MYVQEVGRAGRDGKDAIATLYFNNSDISTAVSGMTKEMRQYCTTKTCRRQYMCEHFGFNYESVYEFDHQCCDNCEKTCTCDFCVIQQDDEANDQSLCQELKSASKSTSDEIGQSENVKQAVLDMLLTYFDAENGCLNMPNATLYTGLTKDLATEISGNYMSFKSTCNLQQNYPLLSAQVVQNVSLIIIEIDQQIGQ